MKVETNPWLADHKNPQGTVHVCLNIVMDTLPQYNKMPLIAHCGF